MFTQEEVLEKLKNYTGWGYVNGQIQKTYSFPDTGAALQFVNQLAVIADHQNHHPDMIIKYNKVTVATSTHDEDGITDKDFSLANQTDQLAIQFI
jgi:4a-hydroxytetrahydrobiopterin dehydratase